ncbi:MAG TPA: FUSC family protein, partial [Polyangiaceae bacterium]|nr:FUSC family protein [Polyangiaceae bacterium]
LLRARAAVLAQAEAELEGEANARFGQLNDEVRLAQALQTARDLVYPAANRRGAALEIAILSRVAELREIVLTARLDLDLLGHDHAARFVRARLALGLRTLSEAVSRLTLVPRGRRGAVAQEPLELPDLLEAASLLEPGDPRARLLPVVAARLRYLNEEVEAIRGLLLGDSARSSLGPAQLGRYVGDDDTWPLRALLPHLSLRSPVLRHALRSALAFTSVYLFAYALPWTARPYWMLLSVAVVLRGTLDDTLSRRNSRVLGTAIGCVLVTALVPLLADPALKLAFVGAVGVSHAFVNVRYLLTAIAATVMALLQAHFTAPTTTPLVVERLLDTVIGALFAWGFSYVLPSWERRTLPAAVERALEALRAYSSSALELEGSRAEQRLARQRAYDALEVVAAALRRSAAEPKRVRPPVKELVIALDHAQRLMAHLSSLRSLLQRRGKGLAPAETNTALAEARRSIDDRLSLSSLPPARAQQSSYGDVPGTSVEQEPLPWLLRRLDASVHDAAEAGAAARAALSQLNPVPAKP